jgi:phosphate acyltransferase
MDPVRIAIDAEGGDQGVPVVVRGVLEARRLWGDAFEALLCGDRAPIMQQLELAGCTDTGVWLHVEHCPERIVDSATPSQVWRRHPGSSVVRCVSLQREGAVDASVSAGDTGVLMSTAVFLLGKSPGVHRPALAATVPTVGGGLAMLLDVGANTNCRSEHLVSFASLGSEYSRSLFSSEEPRVALLNVGEEHFKGTPVIADAHETLKQECRGYVGFIEGSRVLSGDADVIVCDGFVGNAMLKVCESFYALTERVLSSDPRLLETVTRRMAILNADNYGAVPFLGVRGIVLKAHGRSSAQAITSAVGTTISAVRRGAIPRDGVGSHRRREHSYAR